MIFSQCLRSLGSLRNEEGGGSALHKRTKSNEMIFSSALNVIFNDKLKVLVLKVLEMKNTVFRWAKKLKKIWYLLVTEKFSLWTLRWWEIRSFCSAKKLMKRWYLHGIFELSLIFQDLRNMVFRAVAAPCNVIRGSWKTRNKD